MEHEQDDNLPYTHPHGWWYPEQPKGGWGEAGHKEKPSTDFRLTGCRVRDALLSLHAKHPDAKGFLMAEMVGCMSGIGIPLAHEMVRKAVEVGSIEAVVTLSVQRQRMTLYTAKEAHGIPSPEEMVRQEFDDVKAAYSASPKAGAVEIAKSTGVGLKRVREVLRLLKGEEREETRGRKAKPLIDLRPLIGSNPGMAWEGLARLSGMSQAATLDAVRQLLAKGRVDTLGNGFTAVPEGEEGKEARMLRVMRKAVPVKRIVTMTQMEGKEAVARLKALRRLKMAHCVSTGKGLMWKAGEGTVEEVKAVPTYGISDAFLDGLEAALQLAGEEGLGIEALVSQTGYTAGHVTKALVRLRDRRLAFSLRHRDQSRPVLIAYHPSALPSVFKGLVKLYNEGGKQDGNYAYSTLMALEAGGWVKSRTLPRLPGQRGKLKVRFEVVDCKGPLQTGGEDGGQQAF